MGIFEHYQQRYEKAREEEYSIQEFLDMCKQDKSCYASAAERLLTAIGEPEMIDTSTNPRLSRLFSNRVVARYPAFKDFYGMEEAIEQIVSYLKHSAQGLEEKKQILYLLGPVGGGKSSLAEKLKSLMQKVPIYRIKGSPVNDHPFCLFDIDEDGEILEKEYGIPRRYLRPSCLPGSPSACTSLAATSPSSRWRRSTLHPRSDRHRQDRTGRRQQPGHLLPGRQGRYPHAGALRPG
jgi:serine protein kinase